MGMANPIQVAKLTGVLLLNSVYSIPFSTRLGPVPEKTKGQKRLKGQSHEIFSAAI